MPVSMTATLTPWPRMPASWTAFEPMLVDAPGVVVLEVAGRGGSGDRFHRGDRSVDLDGLHSLVPPELADGVRRDGDGHAVDEGVCVTDLPSKSLRAGFSPGPASPCTGR